MNKYLVLASETVFYSVEVEAVNEEQARELVLSGKVELPDAEDSTGFDVLEVKKV